MDSSGLIYLAKKLREKLIQKRDNLLYSYLKLGHGKKGRVKNLKNIVQNYVQLFPLRVKFIMIKIKSLMLDILF